MCIIEVVSSWGTGSIWLRRHRTDTDPALWYIAMDTGPQHLVCVTESGSNDVRGFTNSDDCLATMHRIAEALSEHRIRFDRTMRFQNAEMPPTPCFGLRLTVDEFEFVWVDDPSHPGIRGKVDSAEAYQAVLASVSYVLGDFRMPAPDAPTQP